MTVTKGANYGYYAVAFIDVLGQKEVFAGIDRIPETEEDTSLRDKLLKAHIETVIFIENFRKSFEGFFNAYTEGGKQKEKIPISKQGMYQEMTKCVLKHQRFSDCIQAYTPLQTEKYHTKAMGGVYGILVACGEMLLLSLSNNKAFRAGIDIGVGTEMDNSEIYGPALFNAYELESKIAQYPRIVVGDTLMNYLMSVSKEDFTLPDQPKEDLLACKDLASRCLRMIVRDMDGYPILDYLGDEFRRIDEHLSEDMKAKTDFISKQAFLFIKRELEKWRQNKNQKLAVRYLQIHNYFRARGFKD